MIFTLAFWRGAGERAIKTFFQVFVAVVTLSVGTDLIPAKGLEGVPWVTVMSVSALAALLSLATSIGNASFTAGSVAPVVTVTASGTSVSADAKYAVDETVPAEPSASSADVVPVDVDTDATSTTGA